MTIFRIPYGKKELSLAIPDSFHTELLVPAQIAPASNPTHAVIDALASPIGNVRLEEFAHAQSVAIAINDKTRAVPLQYLLPPLMARLANAGIPDDAITFIIATGAHAPMSQNEFAQIVPSEILARYAVVSHDCDDKTNLINLGTTQRGTPVIINRIFARADLRIVVGNLEPHQFMGFSGGVKTAAVGVCARETITHNHSMMLDPRSNIARYEDNPARQDVEEMGRMIGVHFALNAINNENKQIVHVIAGDPIAVMERGIPLVLELYQRIVAEPFDLTITTPGGHPKDINLYQAQKALAHATFVTKPGGTVILVAACPEGTGSKHYEDWIANKTSHRQVLEAFQQEGYRIGAHKAFQIARDASRERVLFVSEMQPDFVRRLLLTPYPSLESAFSTVSSILTPTARIGIIPFANATIPALKRP